MGRVSIRVPKLVLSERARKFAREVGGIVLGVLIALGLGEIAQSISWANRRGEARDALRAELFSAVISARERQLAAHCVENRLLEIGALLDRASATGRLPAVAPIRTPVMRPWHSTTWQTVVAGETASHFEVETLQRLGYAYGSIDQLRAWNAEEKLAWSSLSMLEGPERPLTPQMEVHLRDSRARARFYSRLIPIASGQFLEVIRDVGIMKDGDFDRIEAQVSRSNARGICSRIEIVEQARAPQPQGPLASGQARVVPARRGDP